MFSYLGKVKVGDSYPVRIMGIINLSPESFYKGSVFLRGEQISSVARSMAESGAEIIDIGAYSTAPYLKTGISEEKEIERIELALREITKIDKDISISVDTFRARVAERALSLGCQIVNDVTGLKKEREIASVVREHDASLVVMAYDPKGRIYSKPIRRILTALKESLRIAEEFGIEKRRIAVDPGIGFFREEGAGPAFSMQKVMPWYSWDMHIINNLRKIKKLGLPVAISISRKSFIGKVLGIEKPEGRLIGSIASTVVAVERGANIIRTHDVLETFHAVRMAEAIIRS